MFLWDEWARLALPGPTYLFFARGDVLNHTSAGLFIHTLRKHVFFFDVFNSAIPGYYNTCYESIEPDYGGREWSDEGEGGEVRRPVLKLVR